MQISNNLLIINTIYSSLIAMKRKALSDIIAILFIILIPYASITTMLTSFQKFSEQLGQSPLRDIKSICMDLICFPKEFKVLRKVCR